MNPPRFTIWLEHERDDCKQQRKQQLAGELPATGAGYSALAFLTKGVRDPLENGLLEQVISPDRYSIGEQSIMRKGIILIAVLLFAAVGFLLSRSITLKNELTAMQRLVDGTDRRLLGNAYKFAKTVGENLEWRKKCVSWEDICRHPDLNQEQSGNVYEVIMDCISPNNSNTYSIDVIMSFNWKLSEYENEKLIRNIKYNTFVGKWTEPQEVDLETLGDKGHKYVSQGWRGDEKVPKHYYRMTYHAPERPWRVGQSD